MIYEWTEWSSCNTSCGVGKRSRRKLCSPDDCPQMGSSSEKGDEEDKYLYEYLKCEASCTFGEVKSIDIDEYIKNNPEWAGELHDELIHINSVWLCLLKYLYDEQTWWAACSNQTSRVVSSFFLVTLMQICFVLFLKCQKFGPRIVLRKLFYRRLR